MNCDDAALAIIEKWGWDGSDPRFEFHVPYMMPLSEAINRLAMEGHVDPAGAILSLLADGKLEATGSYRWMAYRNGRFHRNGIGLIPAFRWAALKEAEAEPKDLFLPKKVSLCMMNKEWGAKSEPRVDWSWQGDYFSTAQASGDDWLADSYFEEVFAAADIELRPADGSTANAGIGGQNQTANDRNKGGAPTKYDWERAVAAIVFQWAEEGSWQPATQADVKNRLADWFAEREQHPSDSLLKERARWLFKEFRTHNDEADNIAA